MIDILFILFFVAMLAGFIDSIAGGGGMITIPALLFAGIPPHIALGTNKFQSVFGVLSASAHFYSKGYLKIKENLVYIILTFVFGALGALSVQVLNPRFLEKIIPFLIILVGIYFLFFSEAKTQKRQKRRILLSVALGCIGFYDGFFGPGTGSFFMLAMLIFGGFNLVDSVAHAKLFNFMTNFASLIVFIIGGKVLFSVGIIMALGQIIGGNLGARVAIAHGAKIIKPLVVLASFVMSANLIIKYF